MTSAIRWERGADRVGGYAYMGSRYVGLVRPDAIVGWSFSITGNISPDTLPAETVGYPSEAEAKETFERTVTLLLITKRIMS